MGKIIGANIIVEYDDNTIVGQRGVSLEGGDPDMIDISDVHDFPDRKYITGWNGEQTINLGAAVLVSGDGGFASWANKAAERTPATMTITLGDGGDVGTAEVYLLTPTMSADMDDVGTMDLSFRVNGKIEWETGS